MRKQHVAMLCTHPHSVHFLLSSLYSSVSIPQKLSLTPISDPKTDNYTFKNVEILGSLHVLKRLSPSSLNSLHSSGEHLCIQLGRVNKIESVSYSDWLSHSQAIIGQFKITLINIQQGSLQTQKCSHSPMPTTVTLCAALA